MIKFKKYLRAFGILAFTALFLISCSSNYDGDFPFVTIEGDDSESDCGYSSYAVVASATASGELLSSVRLLREKIEERTGVETVLLYEDEYSPSKGEGRTIYVGNLKISSAAEFLRGMRSRDYICRVLEDDIYIGGKNDSATLEAIERFIEEILPASNAQRLIPEGGGFEYAGEYETEELNIDGVCIGDFEIVVGGALDTAALENAYCLQSKISEEFGYWLDVRIGGVYTGHNIYFYTDRQCSEGRAELEYVKNNIILRSADGAGLSKITGSFLDLLRACGTEGVISPYIPRQLYLPYGESQCKLAYTALEFLPEFSSPTVCTALRDTVRENSPHMLALGDIHTNNKETVAEIFSEYDEVNQDTLCAFAGADITVSRMMTREYGEARLEAFSVDGGELEFVYVYVSGSLEGETVIDLSQVIGDTPLPVVAVSYTEGENGILLENGKQPFFEDVYEGSTVLYGKEVAYKCYADVSRLAVSDSTWQNTFGIRSVTVAIP